MRRFPSRLRNVVAALLLAVLVIVPVADAFACAFESAPDHASAVAEHDHAAPQGEGDHDGGPDQTHGGCAHHHCHHSTANICFAVNVHYDTAGVAIPALQDLTHALGMSEGPMRPPRS